MRRRVFAATAAVGGACAIFRRPADGRPSIADALALTPALPALVRADRAARPPTSSRLESAVLDARSGARVALCGVCHVDPGSAAAACAAVARHDGDLGAVALEIDARTLAMVDAARQALDAAPADADREATVRAALSALPFAPPGGFSASVPLPPAIAQPLKQGVLYAREMAEAAAAAVAAGAPVHCLRAVQDSSLQSRAAQPPGPVAQLAVHLRAQALHDGAHPQSCARESVVAYEAATREFAPAFANVQIDAADDRIAARVREVIEKERIGGGGAAVGEGGATGGGDGEDGRVVLVVVGAAHVPGLERRLAAA